GGGVGRGGAGRGGGGARRGGPGGRDRGGVSPRGYARAYRGGILMMNSTGSSWFFPAGISARKFSSSRQRSRPFAPCGSKPTSPFELRTWTSTKLWKKGALV